MASLPAANSDQTTIMQDDQTGDSIQHEATLHIQLCSTCWRLGHVAAICPGPRCFCCRQYGHRVPNCPRRLVFRRRQSPAPLSRPPASSWAPPALTDAAVSPASVTPAARRRYGASPAEVGAQLAPTESSAAEGADAS